jgi:GTPase SAR1 family protein
LNLLSQVTICLCFQEFSILPNVQNQKIHYVGSRRTKFVINECSEHSPFSANPFEYSDKKSDLQTTMTQSDTCISADAFLLRFSISCSSLFNTMKYWVPTLTTLSPSTPIVLVGCKSDMRTVHSQAHAYVSSQQALAISKQSGAVMYVETSAKLSNRSTNSAFEVADLACLGHLSRKSSVPSTTLVIYSSAEGDIQGGIKFFASWEDLF